MRNHRDEFDRHIPSVRETRALATHHPLQRNDREAQASCIEAISGVRIGLMRTEPWRENSPGRGEIAPWGRVRQSSRQMLSLLLIYTGLLLTLFAADLLVAGGEFFSWISADMAAEERPTPASEAFASYH